MKLPVAVRTYWPWAIRILISLLFLVSAIAKLYPSPYFAITTFEMKQVVPMGFEPITAAYLSRILIGIEFSLGFLILLPFYTRKIVVPGTIMMLLIFVIQLSVEIMTKGNVGNCGCFGALLPMTPLQAISKNIIAIVLLVLLYIKDKELVNRARFSALINVVLGCVLGMFMLVPIQPSAPKKNVQPTSIEPAEHTHVLIHDSIKKTNEPLTVTDKKDTTTVKIPVVIDEPKQKASGYKQYFSSIDKGKKILCFFAPGCEHCKQTALDLTKLKKQTKDFPELKILFMDEESELIPAFFEHCGATYDYKVLDIVSFWGLIGSSRDTPGVNFLWNGNSIKFYDGINANKFDLKVFKSLISKPYSQIPK